MGCHGGLDCWAVLTRCWIRFYCGRKVQIIGEEGEAIITGCTSRVHGALWTNR